MTSQMIFLLIVRDLKAYRRQILGWSVFALVRGMFTIFVNTHLDRMFAGGSNLIFLAAVWPFLMEIKDTSPWMHTASLPVTRPAIVISRYLSSLSIAAINLVIWVLLFNLIQTLFIPGSEYVVGGKVAFYVWMDLLFHVGVFYFAYYRFNFIVAIAFYFIPIFLPTILRGVFSAEVIPMSDHVIEDGNLFSTGVLVAIGVFMVSFSSSIFHFHRKDI